MAISVVMPALEMAQETGKLVAWRKREGESVAKDAKDPEPHLLAGSLLEKDQPAEAESEYKQTLAIVPGNSDALTALTNLYMRQKRFPDAESLLRKLAVVNPNDAGVHLQLGRMLIIADKKEEAAAAGRSGSKTLS